VINPTGFNTILPNVAIPLTFSVVSDVTPVTSSCVTVVSPNVAPPPTVAIPVSLEPSPY
jgi:hypothetical protein